MIERKTSLTRALTVLCALMLAMSGVGPLALAGSGSAAPAGMSNIPSNAISEDVPTGSDIPITADQLDGKVMASDHADSLAVTLTTNKRASELISSDSAVAQGNQMALILSDDQHSEGRRVAIDSGILQDALGYEPQAIYGTHESGEQWSAPAQYTDGYLVFDVPHFSTNTVTFSGKVDIQMSGATNGTKATYALNGNPSNPNITLTGKVTTETETNSFSGVSGGSISPDIAGNMPATNVDVTLNGKPGVGYYRKVQASDGVGNIQLVTPTKTETVWDGSDHTGEWGNIQAVADFDTDGYTEIIIASAYLDNYLSVVHPEEGIYTSNFYSDPSSNDYAPEVGRQSDYKDTDGDGYLEFVLIRQDGYTEISDINGGSSIIHYGSGSDITGYTDYDSDGEYEFAYEDGNRLDIVALDGTVDDDTSKTAYSVNMAHKDGFLFADGNNFLNYYTNDGISSSSIDASPQIATAFDYDGDGTQEFFKNDPSNAYYINEFGNIKTESVDSSSYVRGQYQSPRGTTALIGTQDVGIDIDSDGTDEVSHDGTLTGSKTVDIGSVDPKNDNWDVSVNGALGISTTFTERSQPQNPTLSINGYDVSHSGSLQNGESVSLSGDKQWLSTTQQNNIVVEIDQLAGDSPNPAVDVGYSHTATDLVEVDYSSSAFQETYRFNRTFADETSDVSATIPFRASNIVGVRNVQYRIDGSGLGWQSISGSNYRLDGTTLDIFASDAYGGSIPSGSTINLKATGRQIKVINGSVSVVDPTKPGESLNSQIRIDQRSQGFAIDVGKTADGRRVHYAYSDDYPTQDYVVIKSDGSQYLRLPESRANDEVRIKNLQTKVSAQSGDVRIDVKQAGSNPKLAVSPGPAGPGDKVTIQYYNTESGVKYLLNSITQSIVLDSDTAQSPAVFEDDDDEDIWTILRDSAQSGSSTGSEVGGAGQFVREQASGISGALGAISLPIPDSIPQPILLLIVGIGGFVVVRRLGIFGGGSSSASGSADDQPSGSGGSLIQLPSGIIASLQRAISGASSGLLRGLRGLLSYIGDILSIVLSNRRATIVGSIALAIGAAQSGLLSLPDGTGILLVVAGIPVASWLILRSRGAVSQRVWLASTLAAVILGLEFVASGTIQTAIEQLTSENVAPLLILAGAGALYLWYRQRQTESNTPDTVNRLIFNGDDD